MSQESLWIVVSLSNELYALPAENVDAMVLLPTVSDVPNTPEHVRGVVVLRERTVPVLDLRVRLGLPSLVEETTDLLSLLEARERDHVNWLNELESSVREARVFELTTDPHACAFGKWYDNYRSDNLLVASLLKKFDAPHRRIHGIADEVVALEKSGDQEAAQAVIEQTKTGDLAEMIRLFEKLRNQIRESIREIGVVVTIEGRPYAFAVDSVETVSVLSEASGDAVAELLSTMDEDVVTAVRCLDRTGQLVVCVTPEGLLEATPTHAA